MAVGLKPVVLYKACPHVRPRVDAATAAELPLVVVTPDRVPIPATTNFPDV